MTNTENKIEFVITQEDVANAIGYSSLENCPFATAAKRILKRNDIYVGVDSITQEATNRDVGIISPQFGHEDYLKLKSGEITEFKAILTLTEY